MKDLGLREVGCGDIAVGFKGGSAAQQAHPLQKLRVAGAFGDAVVSSVRIKDTQQCSDGECPFDGPANLDEVPALAMAHGRVGHALKR